MFQTVIEVQDAALDSKWDHNHYLYFKNSQNLIVVLKLGIDVACWVLGVVELCYGVEGCVLGLWGIVWGLVSWL